MRKSEITPLELCTMEKYSNGTSSSTLSIQGNAFMSRLKLVTSFYKSLSKSTAKTVILNSSGYIPGVDMFLDRFIGKVVFYNCAKGMLKKFRVWTSTIWHHGFDLLPWIDSGWK